MLKDKLVRLFDLQMFNDGGEGGQDPTPKGDDPKGDDPKPTDPKPKEPFATFPDEASFMARLKREAKKMSATQQEEFLKGLGVDSAETLQAIITDHNKRVEGEKTDLQKAIERAEKAERENTSILEKFANNMKVSTVRSIASELGVESKRLDRFMKLVDLSAIKMDNDSIDTEGVKTSLAEILDEFPEFKGITPAGNGGSDFGGENGDKKTLTIEDVRKMSTKEIQDNWEAVQKVLASSKK